MHTNRPKLHAAVALATMAGALLLTLVGETPAFAAVDEVVPAAAPQLSITITDDVDTTDAAAELAYTIRVENLGTTDALGLVVTQSVPEGMTFGSADSAGTAASAVVSWTLDVKAATTATVATTMTVGETSDDLLRLATVACAQVTPTDPPIVCASDSDLLPAGAAAAAAGSDPASATAEDAAVWWIVGSVSALVVVVAALALGLTLRRRRLLDTGADATVDSPHERERVM